MRVHMEEDSPLTIWRATGFSMKSSSTLSARGSPLPGTRTTKLLLPSFHQRVESLERMTNWSPTRPWEGGSSIETRCRGTLAPPTSTLHSSSSHLVKVVSAAMPFSILTLSSGRMSSSGCSQSLRRPRGETPQCSTTLSAVSVVSSTITGLSSASWLTTASRPAMLPMGKTRRNLTVSLTAASWTSGSRALSRFLSLSALRSGTSGALMSSMGLRYCWCTKALPRSWEPVSESICIAERDFVSRVAARSASAALRWASSASALSCAFLASTTSSSMSAMSLPSFKRSSSHSRASLSKLAPSGRPLSTHIK
mmetsp:Transcript_13402/g.38050  ORF Transcript_13402/g.38050 Transcript_13402/m.38050 type:complete len:310 (+) Transcript_13402:2921-3850(+)